MPKARLSVRSIEERNALVEKNIPLAKWVVKRMSVTLPFSVASSEDDDRLSVAMLALIRAAELWESEKAEFSTYAVSVMFKRLRQSLEMGLENCIRFPANVIASMPEDARKNLWCRSIPESLDIADSLDARPDLAAQVQERNSLLRTAIGRLPLPRRQIVQGIFLENRSYKELAAELKISYERVRQQMNSGLGQLKKLLKEVPSEVLFPVD